MKILKKIQQQNFATNGLLSLATENYALVVSFKIQN